MPSIGPQLPPHLLKRKRTPDDHDSSDSPPSKATRPSNEDESSDDGYGPRLATLTTKATNTATPPGPPTGRTALAKPAVMDQHEIVLEEDGNDDDDDDDDNDVGPAAAPPRRSTGPSPPPTTAKRIVGPSAAPAHLSALQSTDPNSDSDSDDYGPALPSAGRGGQSSKTSPHAPPASAHLYQASSTPATSQRDAWMLAPPSHTGYRAPDPTKLKSRKFATGRAAGSSSEGGISSMWTETAEEKARRVADAVLGRGGAGGPGGPSAPASAGGRGPTESSARPGEREKNSADRERNIRSFTEQTRGRSLYEEHQTRRKVAKDDGRMYEEEDDPSKRVFDKEKDMGLATRISSSQRRELLNKAANFGGRFQKGSYL